MLYYFYRVGQFMALRLPLRFNYAVASVLASIYYFFAKTDKKNLKYNLSIVLNANDKRLIKRYIREIFRNFAKYLVDFLRFSHLTKEYIVSNIAIEGKENIDKALSVGRGAIILTAHLGNWELGGAVVASLGYPFYAIALDHKDTRINNFFLKQRAAANVKVIPIGARLKSCFRVLNENKLLAIVGDRDFSNHGLSASFFGRRTLLPRGPALFSIRTGCPIIPAFLIRKKDDSFKLVFEEPITLKSQRTRDEGIHTLMEKYIAVIERYVKTYPDQWYAFGKIWD